MAEHDVVVTGGEVIDGTGAPRRRADVGIRDGRITALSTRPLRGTRVVDASGLVVTPGFVDLHSHADFTLEAGPHATTALHQGVTTLVTGNCGFSPFPVPADGPRHRAPVSGELLSWTWHDAAGFRDALTARRPAVNVGLQVGHGTVRHAVLGDADRPPTPAELDRMRELVATAAEQGTVGFSSGLIYVPGLFGGVEEIAALAAVAAEAGLLYSTHMRNEADRLVEAVEEAITTAARAGARLEISHLKAMGPENHGAVHAALALVDAARERGTDVAADVYPYTASSTGLASRLAPWAVDGGKDALLARLADPATRPRIADALRARFGHDIDPEGVVLAGMAPGRYAGDTGLSIAEVGRREGVDAAEAALRVLEAHDTQVGIVNHAMSEDDVTAVLRHPVVSVASDGGVLEATGLGLPHPRSFGTFARVLGRYVRERGVLDLEEAVRKMTSLPASRIRAGDRGVLREGAAADVVVLDPERVGDRSTYEAPWQLAVGVSAVLVNGVLALDGGRLTGDAGGVVLDGPGARTPAA